MILTSITVLTKESRGGIRSDFFFVASVKITHAMCRLGAWQVHHV